MSDYNLSTDEECMLLKANIMSYIGKYDLLQDEYYQELEKSLLLKLIMTK